MSQYGLPYDYDEPWVSGSLDLSIETLTGTAFEIRVAPTDTIMSIKAKIQRVEGIPVSQQHLLYNQRELENSAAVQDYAIQNGGTLKLILSMRGGPISTRRLPPADEALWREVQEWMAEGRREDSRERLLSASKMTVLVFRDGDQVNLFRVVENDDGTYSPLSDSWTGSSLRNLFTEDDPLESAKRLKENSVTMGKMQELKDKLEKLSITKKDKKPEDEEIGDVAGALVEEDSEDLPSYLRNPDPQNEPSYLSPSDLSPRILHSLRRAPTLEEGASFSGLEASGSRRTSIPEPDFISLPRPKTRGMIFSPGVRKARKEAENIIRLQSKSLSVVVDSHGCGSLKRTPLPEIRRSPRPSRLSSDEVKSVDKEKEVREKTASRMSASSFAIVEEESDMAAGPSMCSSQSSLVALPSNHDMEFAMPPIYRDRLSTSIGPSRYRVSRACYVLENSDRPKSSPSKVEARGKNRILADMLQSVPSRYFPNQSTGVREKVVAESHRESSDNDSSSKAQVVEDTRIGRLNASVPRQPHTTLEPLPPPSKKRPRCLACKKRLNITNTHTCRCGGVFCSTHRYSETHECHFDYKQEGKHLLRLANPLVTAPKLPKI